MELNVWKGSSLQGSITCACASEGTRCSLRSDIFPVFCQFLYMLRDKIDTGAEFRHWDSIHVTTTVRLTLF